MLSIVALNSAVDCFFRCSPVRDWKEFRRLARARCSAPVDHVSVITAVGVKRQLMIAQEAPAFGVRGHPAKLRARSETRRAEQAAYEAFRQFVRRHCVALC